MHWIYAFRNRLAVPGIVALFVAVAAAAPLEALLLPHHQAAWNGGYAGRFIDPLFRLAVLIWCFAIADALWRRWLSKRPSLLPLDGKVRTTLPDLGRDQQGEKTGTR